MGGWGSRGFEADGRSVEATLTPSENNGDLLDRVTHFIENDVASVDPSTGNLLIRLLRRMVGLPEQPLALLLCGFSLVSDHMARASRWPSNAPR